MNKPFPPKLNAQESVADPVAPAAPRDRTPSETPPDDTPPDAWRQHLSGLSRKTLTLALTLLPIVALLNLGVLVWSLGGLNVSKTIVAPGYLGIALALVFVPMVANSIRLALWARFLEVDLTLTGALRVITGTVVANSVTPTTVGGMPLKLLFMVGEGIETRKAVTLLSFQTAEDMVILFGLLGVCASLSGFALADFLAANPGMLVRIELLVASVGWIATLVALALAGLGAAIASGVFGETLRDRSRRWLGALRQSVATIVKDWITVARRGKIYALVNIGLAFLQWSVRFSIAGLVIASFGIDWHPQLYWVLQYLVQALSSVVPTPGAAGGAEAAFLLLFSPFVAMDTLLPAMSAWRLLHFFVPLAGAALAFFALRQPRWRRVRPIKTRSQKRGPAPLQSHQPAE